MFCWIDVYEERFELDQIDQELDCKQREAQRALDAGRWGEFLALAGGIAVLIEQHDAPFTLDVIF
jgi:hypothetical protein